MTTTSNITDEYQPNRIAGFIGKTCTAIVLLQIAIGALAFTGKIPGEISYSYTVSNRTPEQKITQAAADQAVGIENLMPPVKTAAAGPVPQHKPAVR